MQCSQAATVSSSPALFATARVIWFLEAGGIKRMNPTTRFFMLAVLAVAGAAAGQAQPPRGSSQMDLSQYPDNPLDAMPAASISPRFLIEHRSALHGKAVRVRGTVVRVVTPDDAAPSGGVTPRPGGFPQPRIFLADSAAKDLDKNYEVMVLLREGDKGYPAGKVVDIEGAVDGNRAAVVVKRVYRD
jgi:hypothetical protein